MTGAHSGVGKTTVGSIMLGNLQGWGAIKFTRTSLYTRVIDDAETILQQDKDTAILSRAGADRVVWIQSPSGELEGALDIALGSMIDLRGVVIEGNSPVDFLKPYLIIFVIGQDGQIKPSASSVAAKADIVIVNSDKNIDFPSSLSHLFKKNIAVFHINLLEKTGEIDKFITYIKKYIDNSINNSSS